MFNLFGKKQNRIIVIDKIWLSESVKFQGCLNEAIKNNDVVIAVWFDDTYRKLEKLFLNNGLTTDRIFMSRQLARNHIQNCSLVFAEHYPLLSSEIQLFEKLGLSTVTVYSSLDEPLFTRFGGDKISVLIKQLGMKEEEALEHPFISSSIKNAQEKVEKKITFEQAAKSQNDWFLYNLGQNTV